MLNGNGDRNTPFVLSSLMKSRGVKQGVLPVAGPHRGGELKKRPNDMSGQQREWDRNNAGRGVRFWSTWSFYLFIIYHIRPFIQEEISAETRFTTARPVHESRGCDPRRLSAAR